jgi:hypothetical protein
MEVDSLETAQHEAKDFIGNTGLRMAYSGVPTLFPW